MFESDESTPTYEERVGTVIAQRYRLDTIIGRGGLGVVYGGHHTVTDRAIAVKVLHPRFAKRAETVARFIMEAKAAARLNHPNVVEVLDMGEEEDGTVYMVLERLEGEALEQRLRFEGALSEDETFSLLMPVVDAVAAAHRKGIIHRDLKPANVFIHRESGGRVTPKLLDFGIAKFLDADAELTAEGMTIGTFAYMSPEQAQGQKTIGPETDVWSMGVVFYRCLTGELPFDGRDPTTIMRTIEAGRHVPIGQRVNISTPIASIIERTLLVDPTARYRDMGEFAAAIEGARSNDFGGDVSTVRAPAPVARSDTLPVVVRPASDEPKPSDEEFEQPDTTFVERTSAIEPTSPVGDGPNPPIDAEQFEQPDETFVEPPSAVAAFFSQKRVLIVAASMITLALLVLVILTVAAPGPAHIRAIPIEVDARGEPRTEPFGVSPARFEERATAPAETASAALDSAERLNPVLPRPSKKPVRRQPLRTLPPLRPKAKRSDIIREW